MADDPLEIWWGSAVWHEHFFAPDGTDWPVDAGDDVAVVRNEVFGRYDAVEDNLGRFFVWRADDCAIVDVCTSREEACAKAKMLATW